MKIFFSICLASITTLAGYSQEKIDSILPVRGFCIAAPRPDGVDDFIKFINDELAPRKVNTLILRVDFNYRFTSHPELRDSGALSKLDVRKIVRVCKGNKISIILQINLLGHQSWAGTVNNLLRVYPQFDETPEVKMPEKYVWPNADRLYCKSYCPRFCGMVQTVWSGTSQFLDSFYGRRPDNSENNPAACFKALQDSKTPRL